MTSRRAARVLLYFGTVGIVFGMGKVHAAFIADPPYDFTSSFRFAWAFAYSGVLIVSAYGFGLPDVPRTLGEAEASAIGSAVFAAAGISIVQLFSGSVLLPRFVVLGAALLLMLWYLLCVAMAAGGRSLAEERDQVVVVAEHDEVDALNDDLHRSAERPAVVAGALTPTAALPGAAGSRPLIDLVLAARASVVVLNRDALSREAIVAQAGELHEQGVRVRTLSLFYEQWLAKLPINELERVSLMFDIGEIHGRRYGRLKRLFDLVFAVPGTAVLMVAVPFVVLGNLVANRGPLIYRQRRVGRNGHTFAILKFRTMRPGRGEAAGDESRPEWTSADDPRVTAFGRVLRTTHVDELPQMLNILRGDLSLVGPRPEQPHYVEQLKQKLPFYDLRHLVRPGLTGWAQVKYGYAADDTDATEKLQYEFYYLRHQGLRLDARIVGRTVRTVIGREGR